jgi:hypothetical protein
MGYELAVASEKGWHSPEVKKLLERIAENLYLPVEELAELVRSNAEEAADTASFYGATVASELIPVAGEKREHQAEVPSQVVEAPVFLQPDPMLQLTILRELSGLMAGKPNINSVLEMVLEGMYRGIGMDRTLFALRSPDHRFIVGRYALGVDNEKLRRIFQFETGARRSNVFRHVVDSGQSVWLRESDNADVNRLVTEQVEEVTQGADFFVTPIEIRAKVIGVFYADRQPSGRELDADSFSSFMHFANQGNLALTYLSGG